MKIPKKWIHHFDDERKAEEMCVQICKEFETNAALRFLMKDFGRIEDIIKENGSESIEDEIFELRKSWKLALHYYALMDSPKSPFQLFKSDYNEKAACVSQTLNLPEILPLIDDIELKRSATISLLDIDVIRNAFTTARNAYDSVVSDYEWQTILDLQKYIHATRRIVLSSSMNLKPEQVAKVQAEKGELMASVKTAQMDLRDLLTKFYGEDSPVRNRVEKLTQIKTVFEEYTLEKKDFINIGQGQKWEKK